MFKSNLELGSLWNTPQIVNDQQSVHTHFEAEKQWKWKCDSNNEIWADHQEVHTAS